MAPVPAESQTYITFLYFCGGRSCGAELIEWSQVDLLENKSSVPSRGERGGLGQCPPEVSQSGLNARGFGELYAIDSCVLVATVAKDFVLGASAAATRAASSHRDGLR